MSEKLLKKCLHCGGGARIICWNKNLTHALRYFEQVIFVECKKCKNRTENCRIERKAIKAWNRRHMAAEVSVKDIKKVLIKCYKDQAKFVTDSQWLFVIAKAVHKKYRNYRRLI